MALLAQSELAGHAADLGIGEVTDQLLNRPRSNLRPDVHEEDHVRRGFRHAGVDGNRLAAVLFQDDGLEKRMLLLASNSAVPSVDPSETTMISLMLG